MRCEELIKTLDLERCVGLIFLLLLSKIATIFHKSTMHYAIKALYLIYTRWLSLLFKSLESHCCVLMCTLKGNDNHITHRCTSIYQAVNENGGVGNVCVYMCRYI